MSPTIHREDGYVFYFFSFDVISGEPPHVHVGKGSQQPARDAKVWLEPQAHVAHGGRFSRRELRRVLRIVETHRIRFLEAWHDFDDDE